MYFFPKLAAFNLSWHEQPKKVIKSHITGSKGTLTQPGMANFSGDHSAEYQPWLAELKSR
jgi:hypothetical protein